MNKEFVRVDDWELTEEDTVVYNDGKIIIIPFDQIFSKGDRAINTFLIKKESYVNRLKDKEVPEKDGNINTERGIIHYINYFIKYYDEEKELLIAYLAMKYMIDNKQVRIKSWKQFNKMIYRMLFTPSLQRKISRMVEDNYYIDISSDDDKKYPEQLQFTNEHAKIMMKISMSMKLMVPVLMHYLYTYDLIKKVPLYNFYEDLFDLYSGDTDIYNKLWITVQAKVKNNVNQNRRLWEQREIMGEDQLTEANEILKIKLISETMFKYTFDKNIISFNSVVIRYQLQYFLMEKYKLTPVELTSIKDSEGLSGLDKLEMNSHKIDESLVILSNINIKDTIKKIRKSMNVDLPKEEIEFYQRHCKIDKHQVDLVFYYYAKQFGGYRDLNSLTRKQYLKLLVLLKRKLQFQGLKYLPQIITGNADKWNRRTIQNAKFLSKIESSNIYQKLVSDKFSTLEELNKNNMILNLLSTIINTPFTIVDYDSPEKIGEPLEIANPDILSDEFLSFLNQI
jgi:hypothetical protein